MAQKYLDMYSIYTNIVLNITYCIILGQKFFVITAWCLEPEDINKFIAPSQAMFYWVFTVRGS